MAAAPAPWESDPVVGHEPSAAAPAQADPSQPWSADQAVPVEGASTQDAIAEATRRIEAGDEKGAIDILAQHGLQIAPGELDAYHKGERSAGFDRGNGAPSPQPGPSAVDQFLENAKNDLAGIAQGAASLPDAAAEGTGKILSVIPNLIGHALSAAGHTDAADWIQNNVTHPLANPVQVGDVVEKVAPTPDTTAGHVNRFVGQLVGAAVGTPSAAIENAVERAVGSAPKAIVATAPKAAEAPASTAATAQAAQDLGIDLPAFAVQGPRAQAKAASIAKGGFGAGDLGQSAETALDQGRAARDAAAQALSPHTTMDAALGEEVSQAAQEARTAERARIGNMYKTADTQMADTPVPLDQTKQAIDNLIAEDSQALVSSPALSTLKSMQERMGNGGPMTAQALRASAQNLRSAMTANSVDATAADHILSTVRDAMNGDISAAAKGAGKGDAAQMYDDAREQWAQSKLLDKSVLKPMLGAAFQNTGDQVARAIVSAAQTNGTRLAKLFSILPDDTADAARSALIMRMGTPAASGQNAAGDAFSLGDLLKNWNQLKGSRNLVFPPETVQALDKLAQVAEVAKPLEKVAANAASSQPANVRSIAQALPSLAGGAESMFMHDPKGIVLGVAASALSALRQFRAAKLLADTDFARKLASTPMTPKAAASFWSRPWVNGLAAKKPAIAAEIMALQKAFLASANENIPTSAAAQPPEDQNQQ